MADRVEDIADRINNVVDAAVENFRDGAQSSQRGMFSRVNQVVKDLDLNDDGTIKITGQNLEIVNRIRDELKEIIINESYRERVNRYTGRFEELKNIDDEYFKVIAASYTPTKEVYQVIQRNAIEAAQNSLLEAGIDENVIAPVKRLLEQNITAGADFGDLVDNLRVEMKGDPERLGRLERYVQQIAQDSLQQYNRTLTTTVSKDLDLEFYYYTAGTKSTSRKYCVRRAGDYFHKKEVEESASGRWSGKIPGTNESTIFRYCGGYQCQHQYMPVSENRVPKSVIDRARSKGYID